MTHTLVEYLTMFVANFCVVFLLGTQSKHVQHSRIWAAVFTSFGISVSQFMFVKWAASGGLDVFFVCAIGGCAGIAAAIFVHDWAAARKRRLELGNLQGRIAQRIIDFDKVKKA